MPNKRPGKNKISVARILKQSMARYADNFLPVFFITLLIFIISSIPYGAILAVRASGAYSWLRWFPAAYLLIIPLIIYLAAVQTYACYLAYNGDGIDLALVFREGLRKIFKFFVSSGLAGLLMLGGLILLILPGLYFMFAMMFVGMAVMVEKNGTRPIVFSLEIIKGNFGKMLQAVGLIFIPMVLFEAVLFLTIHSKSAVIIQLGLLLLYAPAQGAIMTFMAGMYTELRKARMSVLKSRDTAKKITGANYGVGCLVLIAVAAVAASVAGAAGYLYSKKGFPAQASKVISECSDYGASTGGDKFKKQQIWQDEYLDLVFDMALVGKGTGHEALVLTSNEHAYFISKGLKTESISAYFDKMCLPVLITDLDNDGYPEFIKNSTREKFIVIMSASGKKKFSVRNDADTTAFASWGDLNGDGKQELAINYEKYGRIDFFTADGAKYDSIKAKAIGRVYIVRYGKTNALLYKNDSGKLVLSETNGTAINTAELVEKDYTFYPTAWFGKGAGFILVPSEKNVKVLDYSGHIAINLGSDEWWADRKCAGLVFTGRYGKEYFALLEKSYTRSSLSIYTSAGGIVYREQLKGSYQAMMNYEDGFIIAGEGRIFKYSEKAVR